MKLIFILFCFLSVMMASSVKFENWPKGETFLSFLEKNNIPVDLYFGLEKEGQELCSEITADINYQQLIDDDNKLEQVLIPISEEMQIHLFKREDKFEIEFIPIEVIEIKESVAIPIKYSVYQDIVDTTNNYFLANEVSRAFKHSVDFKKLRKNDYISIEYTQKIRYGKYFGNPEVIGAFVEVRKKKHYIFKNDMDSRYYDEKGRSLTSFFLRVPVRYTRISDRFTNKRWHPILKRYRAHLGIDYAAPTGRPIYAAADGKIIHRGNKGGYGKTIMISHKNNYRSLYAHMHRYGKYKRGQYVKQGDLIGYVGSTGMSTGPHLHFGLYKNGKAIDPDKIIKVTKNQLKSKELRKFKKDIKGIMQELEKSVENVETNTPTKLQSFEYTQQIKI